MSLEQIPPPTPYGVLGSNEQVVAGVVNTTTPTIVSGSGFTVAKNATGDVTITYTTAFSSVPTVALGAGETAGALGVKHTTSAPTTTTTRVLCFATSTGASVDAVFHFIAYIPSTTKTRVPRDFGLVTVLPTSPTPQTNDLCTFTDSLTTPTYTWMLRYNASDSSATKWEFQGGSPMFAAVETSETTASTTYVALTTAGPSLTVPLAGDYDVELKVLSGVTTASGTQCMSFDIGGTGAVDADSAQSSNITTTGMTSFGVRRKTGLTAATALVAKYRTTAGTASFAQRRMRVMPIRVG